jgi:sialate O-acetylesterase
VPRIIGDHMLIQRGIKAPIWGKADPGEEVTVALGDQEARTVANEKGRWIVRIGPFEAGGPHMLTIKGTNTLTFQDVLVGEVWVCSGQSNMQWSVNQASGAAAEIGQANFPNIRLFYVKRTVADTPQEDVVGSWEHCTPWTVEGFSAVAYFFGLELHKAYGGLPIGLIHTSWGGTPSEAWTSRPCLEADPDVKPLLDYWDEEAANSEAQMAEYERKMTEWKQAADEAKARGEEAPKAPQRPSDQRTSPHRPASLYNAMIAPLLPYSIRGGIWYQGESNATRAYQYRSLFPMMITDWRHSWGQGDFPFLFVQLANFRNWADPRSWAELREAQLMALSLPSTGMAVAIDIGETYDIHPKNKQEVGRRLALAARAIAYDEKLTYSGPIYDSMVIEGDRIRLRFKHVDGGLISKGGPLKWFTIAGENHRFVWADAKIDGDTVVVHSDAVQYPVAVRYAWWDDPLGCNLYNRDGLPASPFRTDDWLGVTAGVCSPRDPQPQRQFCQVVEDPKLPRALLIGDSISIDYTEPVRDLLAGKVNVQRIPWNGGDTNNGLARLNEAIGGVKWDVIHFNFGLHDLRCTNDQYQVPIEEYEKNLREIVRRLKFTGARLVWASTTPVPEGAAGRIPDDAARYNGAAQRIMEENAIPINDLYAFALPKLAELQKPRDVHFHDAGSQALAKRVAASVLSALGQLVPESLQE